ncbi:MAG TPA: CHASE2 domain-containing protein, partial [Chroococcales cyanobacterium]
MAVFVLVGVFVASIELLHIPILSDFLSELELRNQDQFFGWRDQMDGRSPRTIDAQKNILLVRIDKESRRRLGLQDSGPCPYQLYTALIKKLHQAGAALVALDVPLAFNARSTTSTKELDRYLQSLKLSGSGAGAGYGSRSASGSSSDTGSESRSRPSSGSASGSGSGSDSGSVSEPASGSGSGFGSGFSPEAQSAAEPGEAQSSGSLNHHPDSPGTATISGASGREMAALRELAAEIEQSKNVMAACRSETVRTRFSRESGAITNYEAPDATLLSALKPDTGTVGNAAVILDNDGTVRRADLTFDELRPSNIFFKSLALRIAERSLGTDAVIEENGEIFFRNRTYPRQYRINFLGPPHTFPMVPIWRALDWERHHARHGLFAPEPSYGARAESNRSGSGLQSESESHAESHAESPAESHAESKDGASVESRPGSTAADSELFDPFKGKIVLVGFFDEDRERPSYSSSAHGHYLTPAGDGNQLMSDMELQANLTANIMAGDLLIQPQGWEYLLIIALVALLFGRILSLCGDHLFMYAAILAGLTALWMLATFYAFLTLHLLIPSVVPNLAVALPSSVIVLIDHYLVRRREKLSRTRLFRSLAAKPMAQEIERKLLAELGLDGKLATVTVLAFQLNEFPKHIKQRPPEEILEQLNACLAVGMRSIGEHSGVVERIWNCGVIGLFGAPIAMSLEEQARRAVDCLVDIQEKLKSMPGAETSAHSEAPFGLTCGISTGEAVCGTLNASSRDSVLMQYGAIGP